MRRAALPALLVTVLLAACGGSGGDATRVNAAASLKGAVPAMAAADGVEFAFAGSDALEQQIREGAPVDALLAASPKQPRALAADGLCAEPVAFATNTLALIVPAAGATVTSLNDLLAGPQRRLAVGAEGVPIGDYAREALATLGASAALERSAVSLEPNASGIVAKVALGSADAGIAYVTDAGTAAAEVVAIPLPPAAQPTVVYEACAVVRDGEPSPAGVAFLEALTSADGQEALARAGFGGAP